MPLYRMVVMTPHYKELVVDAESPAAARSLIRNGDAEVVDASSLNEGAESIVGPVRRLSDADAAYYGPDWSS